MIRRSFEYTNKDMMLHLYKSLVRPVVEYGNIIWGPYYITDQRAIKKIQRRATKLIPELRQYTYQEQLHKLSLPSLAYRRQRGDMILLYQLIHQYTLTSMLAIFLNTNHQLPGVITTRFTNHTPSVYVELTFLQYDLLTIGTIYRPIQ